MKQHADELIAWVPEEFDLSTVAFANVWLVHRCQSAVVITYQRRDVLDPMALGVCRYCGDTLPTDQTDRRGAA